VISIGVLLLYRFRRSSEQQARAQSELEAARSMQEVMVPQISTQTAGFHVESAYLPAQEVGGDFFRLFPSDDGSLLVAVGDVSGKGIKAAMLVSVIIGVLQRSVEITRSPARILGDLNRCLIGQTDGKFATCCCALMHTDGRVTAANAGHLSPYCDGTEIELPAGFPVGLAPDAEYEEVHLNLPAGKRWLFLSDGVVEARNKAGEIYGFDRTRTISVLAVNQIAATAQQFGQEDDITVVGIARQAVTFA
jgi:serine phosphatase RsbU (regulator of sigma subunit)